MGDEATTAARLTAWEVAAVLDLAAAEVRTPGAPPPTWEEALQRVQAARGRAWRTRQTLRITPLEASTRGTIAPPYA